MSCPSIAIPFLLTLLVALSPLRVGDILGLIPRENSFHLVCCTMKLSGRLLQTVDDSGGSLSWRFSVFIVVSRIAEG